MMKNVVCLVVIAVLVAESFGILICANWMPCDITMWTQCCKTTKYGISVPMVSLYRVEILQVDLLQELHTMIVFMTSPQQHTHYQTSTFLKLKNALLCSFRV